MMHLIIDSGATKTEYLLTDDNLVLLRYANRGFNCNYVDDNDINAILLDFVNQISNPLFLNPEKLSFFGAGCGNPLNANRLKLIFSNMFSKSYITVDSDLKSACLALCQKEAGWVGILGTGSSCCYYDGKEIEDIAPSSGYLLGDEGSGTHLGKLFVAQYLENLLEDDLKKCFETELQIDRNLVLQKLYQHPLPNRFLSSVAPFLLNHIDCQMVYQLCYDAFDQFFKKQTRYFQHQFNEISLSGSIAFNFKEIIILVAKKYNICIKNVISSPIDFFYNHPDIFLN